MNDQLFSTPVADCVAIIVDPTSERYGQVGDIGFHDWRSNGAIGVEFADHHSGRFNDGLMSTDTQMPQAVVIDRNNGERIAAVTDCLGEQREELARLFEAASDTGATALSAVDAKQQAWHIIRSSYPDGSEAGAAESV